MSTGDRIELQCPHCAKNCTLGRDDYQRFIGSAIQCPHCNGAMQLGDLHELQTPAVPSFGINTAAPAAAVAAATERKKPSETSGSPRWTKKAMLLATILWIVSMPSIYMSYHLSATVGYKKVLGRQDTYVSEASGEVVSGRLLRGVSDIAAAFMGITVPTILYVLLVFVLGVCHFAMSK